jgi:phosphatidate cytidylyltransferase
MLIQRVATALVLLVLLALSLSVLAPDGFVVLTLLFLAAGMGEWLVLVGQPRGRAALLAVLAALATGALSLADRDQPGWFWALLYSATAIWALLTLKLAASGQFFPVSRARAAFVVAGLALPAVCGLALLASYRDGLTFMVSILAIVWVADIGAYFCGRAFGRHKLAAAISPGKTIEGAIGGLVLVWLVALLATLWPAFANTFFARLLNAWPLWLALSALTALVALSIVVDLLESHLKRQAGVKDSSRLLPGHGGVLDRIDAVLPVIPAALLLTRLW